MIIKKLFLENFRCFKKKELSFSPETNLILGPNTAGKTSILEAIYLLATGNSFRAEKINEMILFSQEVGRVRSLPKLEVVLTPGMVQKRKTPKKKFLVNGVVKKKADFVGQLLAVLFRPEDLRLITGSPSRRRNFLDSVLLQTNWEYRQALSSYQKALRRRNKVLELIQERRAKRSDLFFWDQSLKQNGEILIKNRETLINFINHSWPKGLRIIYGKNKFVVKENLAKEIQMAMTLTGPHRDDFILKKKNKSLSAFGSRSEQRLGILNLKLAELKFIEEETGEKPALLLDDVFSELDESFRERVFNLFTDHQAILTTAEQDLIKKDFLEKIKTIKLG